MKDAVIPNDLPLPLPAPAPVLVAVLLLFFLMHIVFINMMIGGAILTLWYELKGRADARWDKLAHDLAASITVNKSVAVVLGVGPLLAINTLYTTYFYSANALTGDFWISIIPLVAGAFLLTYLHKYLWGKMPKVLHIALIGLVVAIFAFIPLIFLTNVTLMLQPERWTEVRGFWDAASLPNVWTRYAHFMLSCPAMMGLMIVWTYRRKKDGEVAEIGIARSELIRSGYRWALWPSTAQFLAGPLVLFSLPGLSGMPVDIALMADVAAIFGVSVIASLAVCWFIWREIMSPPDRIGRRFGVIVTAMAGVIALMVIGRHIYREAAVGEHRAAMAAKTAAFESASAEARAAAARKE